MSETIEAAWIQGWLTFAAGFFALIGGALACYGAFQAARIQTKLENEKHNALVLAYRKRIIDVTTNLKDLSSINGVHLNQRSYTIGVGLFIVPEEIHPKNWQDHAILGDKAVSAISSLYEMTKIYGDFVMEMRGKAAETNSETFGDERAVDSYRCINKDLRGRADKLLVILKPNEEGC